MSLGRTSNALDEFLPNAAFWSILELQRELAQITEVSAALHNEHVPVVLFGPENFLINIISIP